MKTLKIVLTFLPLLVLGCSLLTPPQDKKMNEEEALEAPVKPQAAVAGEPLPTVIAVCSATKARTIEIIVEWPTALKSFENLRIDISNTKQGFAQNRYAVLWPIEKSKKMRLVKEELREKPDMLAELELDLVQVSKGSATQNAMLKLEGLEPGRVYYWRVLELKNREWQSDQIIRMDTPTCVADFIDDGE
jgi:hypothetical protein